MSFKLTYILLLGIILCPSLNHVTWGLGWLRMCGKFRTAAWPSVTVFFWSVSVKSPMSAKKKMRGFVFLPLAFQGTEKSPCFPAASGTDIHSRDTVDRGTVWILIYRGR